MANLNRLKAQQDLQNGSYEPTDANGMYELYLTAYGDPALAAKARRRAREAFADAEIDKHKAASR